MNIETVNELIQSLESAGELSIREQKFLKLAKAFKQLAAENVALALENVAMKQIVDSVTNLDNEPQYHAEGMGCGLEDRGITDRYDACRYGWEPETVYEPVFVAAGHIVSMYFAGLTILKMTSGERIDVKETPEEIIAMLTEGAAK